MYLTAVADGFGEDIDYAMLVKVYGNDPEGEKRYSPAVCTGCKKENKIGDPDPKHVSTSYIERQNLTMRMGMRRFTRLDECLLKEDREPCRGDCHALHALQLLPHSPDPAGYSGDGGGTTHSLGNIVSY